MVTIRLATQVNAPLERCFRLSLSIDLETAAHRHKAVAGVTTGLIGPGETVTWQGRHFGWTFRHESIIDIWQPFSHFRDVMVAGFFKAYQHDHYFAAANDGTRVRDEVRFVAPMGKFGKLLEPLMRRRVTRLLRQRNALIKQAAESDAWHQYLDGQPELDQHIYQALSAAAFEGESRAFAK